LFFVARQTQLQRTSLRPEYSHPIFSDSWQAFVSFFFISIFRFVSTTTVLPAIGAKLINPKYQGKDREERIVRWAYVCFKLFYFITISFAGYLLLAGKPWVPSSLFGADGGNAILPLKDYPFVDHDPYLKLYIMVSLGYHIHSFAFHLAEGKKRNDFYEMSLHHILTITLIFFSYMINHLHAAALILFVNDLGDVSTYAVKCTTDTKHTYITFAVYLTVLASWGFYRLYVLPFAIVYPFFLHTPGLEYGGRWSIDLFFGMLFGISCLHVLWYWLFLQMGYIFLTSGETKDIVHQISPEDRFKGLKNPSKASSPSNNKKGN
jgi:hypothetical protein